jgi:hypothetical protein
MTMLNLAEVGLALQTEEWLETGDASGPAITAQPSQGLLSLLVLAIRQKRIIDHQD